MIRGLLLAVWDIFREMSPYLLIGFTSAGLLKVLVPESIVFKYLLGKKWTSVVNASLAGVPLPLCSCGVIPVTAHLRKLGVKRGAILSFLTTTPTTGVDSIFATYSLMGGLFTLLRILAAFTIGVFSGITANLLSFKDDELESASSAESKDFAPQAEKRSIKKAFKYAYFDLVNDVAKWLIIGIVVGGMINYFVPQAFIEKYLSVPMISYSIMLVIGMPMYVCSTASIPIAASLIMKGMSPGAGLVFLIAGPATNTATMSFVGGKFGLKTLTVYLFSIAAGSIIWGLTLDHLWPSLGADLGMMMHHHMHQVSGLMFYIKTVSAVILLLLMLVSFLSKNGLRFSVSDTNK